LKKDVKRGMKNVRGRFYALTGLEFLVALMVGILVFAWFRQISEIHNNVVKETYRNYIEHLNQDTLGNMAVYIEKQFPVLHDTERLKAEAGTDWFWETSAEFATLAETFGFAYIYYLEKTEDGYISLMTSDIGRDSHPEKLGGPVWAGPPPAFIEEAYRTGRLTFSPEPTFNEYGSLISAVLPIINNGKVAGVLGVDYDISSLFDPLKSYEENIGKQEEALWRRVWIAVGIFCAISAVILCVQLLVGYHSVVVPIQMIEADEQTRLLMDSTPMICSLWDSECRILDCNEETLNIFGLSRKSDYIDNFYGLNPEYQPNGKKTRDMVSERIKTALENGKDRFEWMFLTTQGEPLPVEVTLVRVPWKNGFRFTSYARDLRKARADEEAIKEVEQRVTLMLDTMTFACYFFDENTDVIDCNRRAIELYHCKDKQELMENFFRLNPACQSDGQPSEARAREEIRKAFREGKNVFRWDHITGDGTPLPVEVTLIRVKWKEAYRVIAYARDMSALRETEANLARILFMTDSSPDPVIYLGEKNNIRYMNPAVSLLSGFTKEELYEHGLSLLFTAENLRQINHEYIPLIRRQANAKFSFSTSLVNKIGETSDFEFSIFSGVLNSGKTGVALLGRNITELLRTQRDLAAAKEQAERALVREAYYNKAKDDFLSRISHEMRTPMNAIIGMAVVARKAAGKERNHCFEVIEGASHRLLDMINDILDITSFDTGSFDWSPAPFNFDGAARSVIDAITPKAQAKRQNFITLIAPDITGTLTSDEKRFRQLLLNLLSNAVKFTPEWGTIGLSARMVEESPGASLIRFEVWDSGIGISPEHQARLWEPFEQADAGITRQYEGLGLGLPIAKRIVEMMKGTIRVESELDKGSRFICDLWFGLDEHKKTAEEGQDTWYLQDTRYPADTGEPPAAAKPSGNRDFSGRRILVVDDNEINRDIISSILKDTGAELDEAENGAQAFDRFCQTRYDLVLMDIHMPVMNGLDATRKMRSSGLPWAETTPVVSLSADTSAGNRIQSVEAGINDYLSKPVNVELLFEKLSQWMPSPPPV
jgi:PAS domain S-box-containing protein